MNKNKLTRLAISKPYIPTITSNTFTSCSPNDPLGATHSSFLVVARRRVTAHMVATDQFRLPHSSPDRPPCPVLIGSSRGRECGRGCQPQSLVEKKTIGPGL
jgi:hypothetical protein